MLKGQNDLLRIKNKKKIRTLTIVVYVFFIYIIKNSYLFSSQISFQLKLGGKPYVELILVACIAKDGIGEIQYSFL